MNYSKMCLAVMGGLFIASSSYAIDDSNYQGSGDESGTVNSYMTYPTTSSSNIEYTLGKKRAFKITYGNVIDKTSFSFVLNGKDMSKRFHPVAGETEKVYFPLRKGINNLSFKISDYGDESNGVVPNWDIDEFSITLKGLEVTPRYLEPPQGFEKGAMPPARVSNSNRPEIINKSKR